MSEVLELGPESSPPPEGGSTVRIPAVPSFMGAAVSGGCGCMGFLAGAALAIALFAPKLLSGWAARVVELNLTEALIGQVVVEDLRPRWRSPQTARTVKLFSEDGQQLLLEGSLTIPSLADLVLNDGREGTYALDVRRLYCRVGRDGVSDLARALGLDVDYGATVIGVARELFAERALMGGDRSGNEQRLNVSVHEAKIESEGQVVATLSGLELLSRSHARGLEVELANCRLEWVAAGPEEPAGSADVSGRIVLDEFGGLALCNVRADAVPASVRRTLGWSERRSDGSLPDAGDARSLSPGLLPGPEGPRGSAGRWLVQRPYGSLAGLVSAAATALSEGGAELSIDYGPAPVEEGAAPSGERLLTVSTVGPGGYFDLDGRVVDGPDGLELVPRQASDRQALRFGVEAQADALVPFFESLAPEGGIVEARGGGGTVRGAARSFRIPLPAAGFQALLGRGADSWVESMLRSAEAEVALVGPDSGNGLRASIRASGTQDSRYDRVDLGLWVAELELFGRAGGRVRTTWTTNEQQGLKSVIRLSLPGRGDMGRGDMGRGNPGPAARLDVDVRQLPRTLLQEYVELPASVAGLLNYRIGRVALGGILVGPGAARGAPRVDFEVYVGYDENGTPIDPFIGWLDGSVLRVRTARVNMDLSERGVLRVIFLRNMPWLADVKQASEGSTVRVEFSDLEIELGSQELRESGTMTVTSEALRVRLDAALAEALDIPVEGLPGPIGAFAPRQDPSVPLVASEWIDWQPRAMRFELNRDSIAYVGVELPLQNDEAMYVSGGLQRGMFTLRGTLEKEFLPASLAGLEEASVIITGTKGGSVELYNDTSGIKSLVNQLRELGR